MTSFILRILFRNGQTQDLPLDQLQTLTAVPGAVYTIIDTESGEAPEGLSIERKNQELELQINHEIVAEIEAFYADEMTATFALDGSFAPTESMALRSADLPPVALDLVSPGFTLANPATWGWAGVGGGVAAAGAVGGGVAGGLASDGGDDGGSADTTGPAAPSLALANDTGSSANDGFTNDGTFNVLGLEPGATWEYSTQFGSSGTWNTGSGSSFELGEGTYSAGGIFVRQTDAAGNTSSTSVANPSFTLTVDLKPPSAPTFALANDDGASNSDGITSDPTINVNVSEFAGTYEYSTDGGSNWSAGSSSSFELNDDTAYAVGEIQVRQIDLSGNTGPAAANDSTIQIGNPVDPVDPSIVVFDLVNGESSSHSGRVFDSGVEYTIYIRIDSDAQAQNFTALDFSERWTSASNLSSNDTFILVGTGAPIDGQYGSSGAVNGASQNSGTVVQWQTAEGFPIRLRETGRFARTFTTEGITTVNTAFLWSETQANFGSSGGAGFATTIPAGVLTSQGLV